jgi:8-oxo-dGTP pyrophosphatase MutT (NUDIX family)
MTESNSYTLVVNNRSVILRHIGNTWIPPFNKVTSVAVIPFTEEGKIMAVKLRHRGIDIPGGHVEAYEKTPEETLRREVLEEAHMTIREPILVEVIQSDLYGPIKEDASYMLLYTAFVDELHTFQLTDEHSYERIAMDRSTFIEQYEAGSKELMGKAIEKAWVAISEEKV